MVAPITWSPTVLLTGKDSPVTTFSSMWLLPSIISPSTGIFSPGRTTIISPSFSWFIGTVTSWLSFKTWASLASNFKSSLMAAEALPFATTSKYLPNNMKNSKAADDSQNGWSILKNKNPTVLYIYAADVPKTTRTSMFAEPTLIAVKE